jgi:CelD/BcsL family acetyltransferase involved in cellulose biosynthesis
MMRHMLDEEKVAEVDFGHGDDLYKQSWLPERRERWGILAFNPHTIAGLALAARHIAGRSLKRRLLQISQQVRPLAGAGQAD